MNKYMTLYTPYAVYVKEYEFFKSQGGLEEPWGSNWKLVYADGISHARLLAKLKEEE